VLICWDGAGCSEGGKSAVLSGFRSDWQGFDRNREATVFC